MFLGEVSGGSGHDSSSDSGSDSNSSSGSSSEAEEKFDDGFDQDLMGDAEDRKKIDDMTQVEREKIIFERLERREAMRTR